MSDTTTAPMRKEVHYFSNYKKVIWDFHYEENTPIHLVFNIHSSRFHPENRKVVVRWSTERFKGAAFTFEVPRASNKRTNWEVVFSKLRLSLVHGLNSQMREVSDKIMGVDKLGPHPIHQIVRTSKNWGG